MRASGHLWKSGRGEATIGLAALVVLAAPLVGVAAVALAAGPMGAKAPMATGVGAPLATPTPTPAPGAKTPGVPATTWTGPKGLGVTPTLAPTRPAATKTPKATAKTPATKAPGLGLSDPTGSSGAAGAGAPAGASTPTSGVNSTPGSGGRKSGNESPINRIHGTTRGFSHAEPTWSAGVQVGNGGGTALNAEKVGITSSGALSLSLGPAWSTYAISIDYLMLLDSDFAPASGMTTYNAQRGVLLLYVGGGVAVADGIALRLPMGAQYTMLRDPFNFYGGVTPILGRFYREGKARVELWAHIGGRLLL